jgi:hypothetical protein
MNRKQRRADKEFRPQPKRKNVSIRPLTSLLSLMVETPKENEMLQAAAKEIEGDEQE